ncbi:MAG: enoyl-CoA hydratase [Phenylobacterium sp.]|jgi:enoyl-CoA hydratase/carnithine racemase|uniref:enoyl-CoA hydratase/isomerase family protein n=1 Tax=Phenylobacterium sp. TaxID=1871053 RepID=UPI001228DAAB|nr:enoyl-CoA hydratase-related protein [Phenylobacterium sp.]TAL32793.1 MAG: enoyl-CoA hydratase [Phenylobacterium sp.]
MAKVKVTGDGAVREVTLTRGEKRNALDAEMLTGLTEAFARQPDATERVTVIRAEGPVFCSGLDLRERGGGTIGSSAIEAMLHAIELHPLPVVAVVQGDAIAGGNELALHCDFVVAAETARFGMSLAKIGLAPSWFLAKKLLEVAGPVGAREMLLLGDLLPARRMAEMGLIHRAVPAAELEDAARAVIDRLAGNAPLSLRAMKALMVRAMTFRDSIAHGDIDALVAQASASADAREGIAAMLEKRPPRFEGH